THDQGVSTRALRALLNQLWSSWLSSERSERVETRCDPGVSTRALRALLNQLWSSWLSSERSERVETRCDPGVSTRAAPRPCSTSCGPVGLAASEASVSKPGATQGFRHGCRRRSKGGPFPAAEKG